MLCTGGSGSSELQEIYLVALCRAVGAGSWKISLLGNTLAGTEVRKAPKHGAIRMERQRYFGGRSNWMKGGAVKDDEIVPSVTGEAVLT